MEKILIVDDDVTLRLALKTVVERQRYEVIEADSVETALDILKQTIVVMVISDVHMPGLTGIDLLTSIKKNYSSIPVIIITGNASVEAAVECMKIGAADYISKPFSLLQIENSVARTMETLRKSKHDMAATMMHTMYPRKLSMFNIIERLGEGNMGIVYLVDRMEQNKKKYYALKLFKNIDCTEEEKIKQRNRFCQEAEAVSRVNHPNIVKFVEFGSDDLELANFIVMEHIQGKSLKQFLSRSNLLTYKEKSRIIYQIADALTAIHELNIFHRDIKPANIMINEDLKIKIMDFGIAKLPHSALTQKNDLIGSPSYMAPEAYVSSQVDHRADIFSLGIIAYELYMGVHPFKADNFLRLSFLIRNCTPKSGCEFDPDFPKELQAILDRMLAKNPKQRYQNAHEICGELNSYLDNH